ncbi:hypothetical protein [Phaeobacter inhibens]|uniref:hypothetical protein n=1 Tax=Phaeobacter inhibens TaxID=221822 RepID=UPI000C9BBC43|nr:hypothetical protein [Phaeobacter inhibens]AUQ59907.1 hypothetical protein PhaeoP30_03028 [Phaeobacter inhibens]AUQ63953.1 hypothetical protein PhaeoP51_03007 [Phaeobacter inhibens]AUQ83857.1 hypothetical protein PhaeoP57_02970 [Phaeobacter inhibens]AUQ91665.1 hypothetical protein PhaeoP24_03087 [Phaeobacter inhibens]AUR09167.1 hypothetical protein PhaeoP59_03025 [Phaeobacter inhibens]
MPKEREIRNSIGHLVQIKAHMLSMNASLKALKTRPVCGPPLVRLRQSYLDLRMIVEEMMLLSVSAHRTAGEQISNDLRKNYNASQKMRLLEKINPRFFPDAIKLVTTEEKGVEAKFVYLEKEYLCQSVAQDMYNKSGNFLHASYKALSVEEFDQSVDELQTFFNLTATLLHTFEVDISGKGLFIAGHLNLLENEPPVVFHAQVQQ